MNVSERWTPGSLADGEWIRQDFGRLSIVVLNLYSEWRVASYPDGAPEGMAECGKAADLPDDIAWERWDHHDNDRRLQFRPAFPAMPVVARPHSVLHLSPKGQAAFFVGIPACIEVLAMCQGSMLRLTGFATQSLSKTWHGTPISGRLGYSLRTDARRVFQAEEWPEWDIVCAIELINDAAEPLPFERLFLATDHLSVFEKAGRLWSNAARIRVAAEGANLSNITYASRPAAPNENAVEISEPRKGRIRRSTIQSAFAKVLGHFNPLEEPS
jgi:hypothetical protein